MTDTAWDHNPPHITDIKDVVRRTPSTAQGWLLMEYKRARPRYTLITWLKRHRPHNATTRVIKAKP